MTYSPAARFGADQQMTSKAGFGSTPSTSSRAPLRGPLPRPHMMSRPYNIAWLSHAGEVSYDTIVAPSVPVIESACANVARGTLISTTQGPVAVEDLAPGMGVLTSEYGPLPLQWVGSYDMTPRDAQTNERGKLFRVTSDAFGLAKPASDLMLAPRSHILMRHAACKALFGVDLAFAPVRAFEDGVQVVSITPISSISLFNLAFDRQATILANGVEVESFHPGPFTETLLDDELLYSLLRLFPQARSLESFGPQLTQRLTSFEVRALREGA
ncbi:Hint domain-containing protein [uncultured Litoreibacter sp.]|uniref:Hint domain-containing protein n=1 Tax=uncultured Litoreibacter sp. TaxID=1392394 RepID=UPI002612175D|nr:Hint domain-containing protein [uncultured Litoreibacter sp.]